jgi:hypothetical protein
MEREPSRQEQALEGVGTYFISKDGCTPLTSGLGIARAGTGTERESRRGMGRIQQLPKRYLDAHCREGGPL